MDYPSRRGIYQYETVLSVRTAANGMLRTVTLMHHSFNNMIKVLGAEYILSPLLVFGMLSLPTSNVYLLLLNPPIKANPFILSTICLLDWSTLYEYPPTNKAEIWALFNAHPGRYVDTSAGIYSDYAIREKEIQLMRLESTSIITDLKKYTCRRRI